MHLRKREGHRIAPGCTPHTLPSLSTCPRGTPQSNCPPFHCPTPSLHRRSLVSKIGKGSAQDSRTGPRRSPRSPQGSRSSMTSRRQGSLSLRLFPETKGGMHGTQRVEAATQLGGRSGLYREKEVAGDKAPVSLASKVMKQGSCQVLPFATQQNLDDEKRHTQRRTMSVANMAVVARRNV
jgi:hypothetical protein